MSSPKYCELCSQPYDPTAAESVLTMSVRKEQQFRFAMCPVCRLLVEAVFQAPEGDESFQDAQRAADFLIRVMHDKVSGPSHLTGE